MAVINFKVGDLVSWEERGQTKPHKFIGKIVSVNPTSDNYTIQFGQDFKDKYKLSPLYRGFSDINLTYSGPPLTKEQSLNLKCKILWNNSEYVKKNPKYAY